MPRLLFTLTLSLLAMASAQRAVGAPITQQYEILPGSFVHRQGGIRGESVVESIEGTISFQFEIVPGVSVAEIVDSNLTTAGSLNFPLTSLPPIGFQGTVENSVLHFTNPFRPHFDWTFSPIGDSPGDVRVWTGFYDESCCDRYAYSFPEPVSLVLVPEPSTSLLLATGLTLIAANRRRCWKHAPAVAPSTRSCDKRILDRNARMA